MIEDKEKITLGEFKAWLAGLILGKNGAIPDLEDWKQIKVMLDKVEEKKEYVTLPSPPTTYPWDLEPRERRYGPIKYTWTDGTVADDLVKLVDGWYKE